MNTDVIKPAVKADLLMFRIKLGLRAHRQIVFFIGSTECFYDSISVSLRELIDNQLYVKITPHSCVENI